LAKKKGWSITYDKGKPLRIDNPWYSPATKKRTPLIIYNVNIKTISEGAIFLNVESNPAQQD